MTRPEKVDLPDRFISELGGMHDVEINLIEYNASNGIATIGVDDLHANFSETAEYKGLRNCRLIFSAVSIISMNIDLSNGLRISNAVVLEYQGKLRLEIDLSVGGGPGAREGRSIAIAFSTLELIEG